MGEKAMKEKAIMRKVLSCLVIIAILMSVVPVSIVAMNGSNNATDKVLDSLSEVDTHEDIVVSGVDDVTYEAGCNFSDSNITGNTSNSSNGAITYEEVVASGFAGVVSAQDVTISNPAISSGTEISKADMVAVSAKFEGKFTVSQWNWLMANIGLVDEIKITYVVELWESIPWWPDKKLATKSFVHKAEFPSYKDYARVYIEEKDKWDEVKDSNEFNELMRNLDAAPIKPLDSDKDVYAKVKARMEIKGYSIFDPFGLGHQQETEWSESNTISVHVYGNPSPLITYHTVYPKTIKLGEKIVIWIDCKNNGGKAGPYSTISVSFPSLTDPNDDKQVIIKDHDFHSFDNCYLGKVTKGDQIWVWQGNNKVPVMKEGKVGYLLVEGGTSKEGGWDSGKIHTLGMEVYPKKPGTFDIYYRVTLTTLTDANDLRKIFYIPFSGLKDQQNFYVFHESVTVTG